jgi:hypothetical protein
MNQNQTLEKIRQVKARHEQALLKLANVVSVGIGFKEENGRFTNQLVLVVNVSQKKPLSELAGQDVVPPEIDGVPTDVQEVGQIRPL